MGCSYDPAPQEYWPTPRDQWMTDNHFGKVSTDRYSSGTPLASCLDCGTVLVASKQGTRFLRLHIPVCPINPRVEIPQKTEEELKTDEYRKVRYV